jgi:hypothetical protein
MEVEERRLGLAALIVVGVTLVSCGDAPVPSAPLPPLPMAVPPGATHGPSVNGQDVDCDRLLPAADLEAAIGQPVQAFGWNLNSCFWAMPTRRIQLVLQTGPEVHRWFTGLRQPGESAGMTVVIGYDFEALEKPGSFGGFVPGRAALLHSPLSSEAAAPLVRQVLARL